MRRSILFITIALVATILASCDSYKVYEEYVEIDDYTWSSS